MVKLNAKAAAQARHAIAYQTAYDYILKSISHLLAFKDTATAGLVFEVYLEAAECAYLSGRSDQAEKHLSLAESAASNNFERCQLMNLRVVQLISEGDYVNSMVIGISALRLYGIELPDIQNIEAGNQYFNVLQNEFDQSWIGSGRTIADLYDLAVSDEREIGFIMELLGSLYASALMSYPDYLKVITITLVELSIKHGNTPISPIAYAWHGSSIAAVSDHYDDAYEFGQLAIRLNEEKIHNPTISCKLYNMVANFIAFFKDPLRQTLPLLRRAYELGVASGDKLYAGYSVINEHRNALSTGLSLKAWLAADDEVITKLSLLDAQVMIEVRESFKSHVMRLMGKSLSIHSLDNDEFKEREYREKYAEVPLFGVLLDSWRIQSSYLLEDYEDALALSCFDATAIDSFVLGTEMRFFGAITILYVLRTQPDHPESERYLRHLNQYKQRIQVLAKTGPENFAHLWNLLEGEQARLDGQTMAAAGYFNTAITYAHDNRFLHYEALANELLADLYYENQLTESASSHIKQAYALYRRWGCDAKLILLQSKYPEWDLESTGRGERLASSSYLDETDILKKVDFNSLVDASLALSSEMEIDRLVDKLMSVALENAGAEKCLLLMERKQYWQIVAERYGHDGFSNHSSNLVEQDSDVNVADIATDTLNESLPLHVFNYVTRSNQCLVLGDASSHKLSANDPYVIEHQIKSLICIPLVHKGETRAILYLENNLGKNAFTQDQVSRLELLSSQMAAAIENAENYRLLADQELENRRLLKSLPVGIIVCDNDARITYANPLAYKLLKPKHKELSGLGIHEIEGRMLNETGDMISIEEHPVNLVLSQKTQIRGAVFGYQLNSESDPRWYMISAFPQYQNDQIDSVITCVIDITERRQSEQKVQHLAYHDSLTDLPNRSYLEMVVGRLINAAQAEQCFSALVIMDLDNFNVINDSLGHWFGDKMLNEVVHRVRNLLKEDVFFSRLGGDEFALVLTSLSPSTDALQKRIDDIRMSIQQAFETPFVLDSHHVKSTVSFGVSVIPEDGSSVEVALRYADIALSQSKKTGRNKLSYFRKEHETELQRHIELERDMHTALAQNQFKLVYQPKVNIESGDIVGAEALVRWIHPDKGMISPVEFIPIAEGSELIIKLGDWVLDEACRQTALWKAKPQFKSFQRMSVNVSPFQFNSPHFMQGIHRLLQNHQLTPQMLDLEVTEYLLLEQTEIVIEKLNQLRNMGITVSIDDFGTGYSSLSYLKRLPVDTLKVDQSFVFEMTENDEDKAIVQTVLAMAKTLKLKTVAEGVESAEHLDLLKQFGCDQYQGYYFSKPIDPEDFEALISNSVR